MTVQIINYGACIRLVTDSSVLMLAKSQIVNIEVIRDDTVKINIGEGPLQEILIKLADVTQPAGLPDVAALRDYITHLLDYANQFEVEALLKQQLQIDELIAIKQLFNLWHTSLQVDLNFQQLQANELAAINNRLLETRENNIQFLDNQREQTTELKNQVTGLTALDVVLKMIKDVDDSIFARQGEQLGEIQNLASVLGAIKELIATIPVKQDIQKQELDIQAGLLTNLQNASYAIRDNTQAVLTKQDAQTNKLTSIDTTSIATKGLTQTVIARQDEQITKLTDQLQYLVQMNNFLSVDNEILSSLHSYISAQNPLLQSIYNVMVEVRDELRTP